jgi:hypothetical protein
MEFVPFQKGLARFDEAIPSHFPSTAEGALYAPLVVLSWQSY